jgi:hypothetical protein
MAITMLDQQKTSYSDTTPQVRAIGDLIHLIDPVDTPLVSLLGLDSARSKFRLSVNGTKIEWLEDSYDAVSGTCNQGTTITTSTLTITLTDASVVQPGHVLLIDAEYMVVATVNTTSNAITVKSRAYGGTNATHATGATFTIVGMARDEGDDADYGGLVDITAPYNYTSIFQKALNISGTQQAIDQYGIPDEFMYQSNKIVPHLTRLVERAIFHGVRAVGSASTPRSFGGLGTFITDNSQSLTTSITKAAIDGLAELIMADGGMPDILVMNQAGANNLRSVLDSSSFVRVPQENNQFGMNPIEYVVSQFFNLRLIVDRWCPATKAYMLDSRKVGLYTLRPFASYEIARTGDSVKGEVIGEFSLAVANDSGHGYITTSASEL